ncbi:hypothetical protein [Phenylobacterium sp.]|uniref:hypothetical protein n=1 Tax=Phenylobacterium sp. TaxID=1871053 RepID=UPI00301CE8A1
MSEHNDRLYEEAAALWRSLYDAPPPTDVDGPGLLGMIVGSLPASGYERLATPHLRPANIVFPKR